MIRRKKTSDSPYVKDELIVKFKLGDTSLIDKIANHPNLKIETTDTDLDFHVVKVSDVTLEEMIKELEKEPAVEYIEYNRYLKLQFTPNDPLFAPYQYSPQLMRTTEAWNITQSSSDVIIAIIDSGVDIKHPDLAGKVIPGPDYVDGGLTTKDSDGHGTFCAGIAAAVTNNGIGVAGMAPQAKILALRISKDDNLTSTSRLASAIAYAANHGAQVINISMGNYDFSKTDKAAVKFAWDKGVVLFAAAGNEATSLKLYPAAYPYVVAVGATTASDLKAPFSNYGKWVDLVAPGTNIWSTLPPDSNWVHTPGTAYTVEDGTSFSSPNVAGVAALLVAQGLSNQEIVEILQITADKIPGTGFLWKHGRVNALAAVNYN